MRPIQATINLAAFRHNLAVARQHAPQSKVMAVIKANGYGHGLLNAAQGLADAEGFAVLSLSEALDLRHAGYEQNILLLEGLFDTDEALLANQHRLSLVIHQTEQVTILEALSLPHPFEVFVKINTGMNRLGFQPEQLTPLMQRLKQCANVGKITLMTHFANADEAAGIAQPLALFQQTVKDFSDYPISLANSASVLRYPESHGDWVRAGIMLYGATPFADTTASQLNLRPVMRFSSRIIAIQTLSQGDGLGYGHAFVADQAMRIGVVACGYADGYPRHAKNGTPIAVAGKSSRLIGRVSMDMLFVDLSHLPDCDLGDEVELWGDLVPVDAVAHSADTIGYELLCAVAARVPLQVSDRD